MLFGVGSLISQPIDGRKVELVDYNLRDILGYESIKIGKISDGERVAFFRAVDEEMKMRGFDKMNESTARTEMLSGEDYRVVINV